MTWNPQSSLSAVLGSDRGPVPAAVEDASDSAWAEYDQCWERMEQQARLQRQHLAPARGMSAAQRRAADMGCSLLGPELLNTEEVMRLVRQNNRVCPKSAAWRQLYLLLPTRRDGHQIVRPPYPIDSASMKVTTDLNKQLRLRSQIEWAEMTGALPAVAEFLRTLPEAQWHHVSTAGWPDLN